MRSRAADLRIVFWLVVMLVAICAGIHLSERNSRRPDIRRDHAIDSYNRWGTRAVGELLESQGFRVASWRERLTGLGPQHQALVVLSPSRHFVSREIAHLLKWIEGGGTLLVAPSRHTLLGSFIIETETIPPVQQILGPLGLMVRREGDLAGKAVGVTDSPLLREVAALYVPSHLRLQTVGQKALAEAYPEAAKSDSLEQYLRPQLKSEAFTALATRDDACAVGVVSYGKGWVLILGEADMLGNYWINQQDNAVLALNFAYLSGAETVYFDEYHHGLTFVSIAGQEALSSGAWRVLLMALAAVGLFFLGQMVRFGAAVPLQRQARRSAREFVRALAQLYMQAGARTFALQIITGALRRQVAACGRVSLSRTGPEADNYRLAQRCADLNPSVKAAALSSLLDRLDAAAQADHRLSNAEFVRLSRAATAMEKELPKRGTD